MDEISDRALRFEEERMFEQLAEMSSLVWQMQRLQAQIYWTNLAAKMLCDASSSPSLSRFFVVSVFLVCVFYSDWTGRGCVW